MPLVTHSTGANVPDVNELLPLVDDIPPVRRKADRPRRVPDNLYADRAYDSQPHRQELEPRMIPTWRGVGPNTAVAWGSIAGWRSGPCRGCTAFAGSGCGPIERVRSMMPSSRWLQLSYVCGSYDNVFLLGLLSKSGFERRNPQRRLSCWRHPSAHRDRMRATCHRRRNPAGRSSRSECQFLHAHSDIFFQLIPPAVGEVLGVDSRVFRDRTPRGTPICFLPGMRP